MRHTSTSATNGGNQAYSFSIRGQVFSFDDRQAYQEAWGQALEIADRQQRYIESGGDIEDFDLEAALEDSAYDEQYELNFDNNHLSNGDECTCSGCIESESLLEDK